MPAARMRRAISNRSLNLRMARIGEVAEIRGKVARPDEDPIDALDRGDIFDFTKGLARLHLD